jgi:acyl-CoA synthetase (AMP-forming)/AMP-acid ligase II
MKLESTLVDKLARHADQQPNSRAYVFLSDSGAPEATLTFAHLYRRARGLAARLAERSKLGDRALLIFPQCLEFIVAFFACLIAGIIAVPMMPPRRLSARDSSSAIITSCTPRFAITSSKFVSTVRKDVMARFQNYGMTWVVLDSGLDYNAPVVEEERSCLRLTRDDTAFLQYTSGSTSDPKGVIVSHGNLLDNLEMMRVTLCNSKNSTYVSWVPLYHDMGLILNVLETLYLGSLCVLMTPVSFLQRPLNWLRAIHDYRAEVASAPNFAFDLCVTRFRKDQMDGVDLSNWKVSINAAEPVHADTIKRFTDTFASFGFEARSVCPCYGLAEATVMVSGRRRSEGHTVCSVSREGLQTHRVLAPSSQDDTQHVVGCGRALAAQHVAIVNPDNRRRIPFNAVGEIWVCGPNITSGYWRNEEATGVTFRAQIESEGKPIWLRTGDLGFMDESGEIFVTGRIKDVIVIRGMNHYPQDIEDTVQDSNPALRRYCGAAFATIDASGNEDLILVQEIERTYRNKVDFDEIISDIREAVSREHDLFIRDVVLVRTGTIPKTTSGKIQRSLTRELWRERKLVSALQDDLDCNDIRPLDSG